MLIDSHCHLDFPDLADHLQEKLDLMAANGVEYALCAGVTLEDFPRVLALAENHSAIFAAVGVHPEVTGVREPDVAALVAFADHSRVVAIGETGLDYHWHKDAPDWQRARFRTHIHAALEAQKPLIVHNRDATLDVLRLLKEEGAARVGGVIHCFTESWEMATQFLDAGFYLSFSGIVTFKNAKIVRDTVSRVPLDRLLIETDSPYLSPVPHRGKTNEPGYVKFVAEEIARLRNVPFDDIAHATSANFFKLFSVEKPLSKDPLS